MTQGLGVLQERLDTWNPQQQGVQYLPWRWAEWLTGIDTVTLPLEDARATITRSEMCTFVDDHVDERPVDALVTVLQWGYGVGGRGPSRARKILTGGVHDAARTRPADPTVATRLAASADTVRTRTPREAYAQMAYGDGKIAGLGPAFFTKWLYAVSAKGDPRNPAALPVLDGLVQNWISRETGNRLRYGRADDYARYVDLLDEWTSLAPQTTRVDVELAIFTLERERRNRTGKTPHAPAEDQS
jgi:hypothetical protein